MIHRAQLHDFGLTDKQIGRGQATGVLHELYVDVWTVGHRRVSPTGRLVGALLSCGPHSFLSHRTAAALHKLRPINVRAIEVSVVGSNPPRRPGLTMHRTRHEPVPEELRTRGLLRFSSFLRMLAEVAPIESDQEIDRLVTEGARRRLLHPDAVERALQRYERWPGSNRLKTAVARYRPEPDRTSELERAFDRWLRGHPEIPEPERNVEIGGWEIDCWWPQQRVALELDGRPYHVTAQDMDRDRVKDTKLQLLGIRLMRVTDFGFHHDPDGVAADLLGLLALG